LILTRDKLCSCFINYSPDRHPMHLHAQRFWPLGAGVNFENETEICKPHPEVSTRLAVLLMPPDDYASVRDYALKGAWADAQTVDRSCVRESQVLKKASPVMVDVMNNPYPDLSRDPDIKPAWILLRATLTTAGVFAFHCHLS
jgi:FtsP/CotA-like multicopper oxidase with cupredoxin domain